jgi:hypothetical protein
VFDRITRLTGHLWCSKIYALDAVGPIPEELWNLTALTNLYGLQTFSLKLCIMFHSLASQIRFWFNVVSGI